MTTTYTRILAASAQADLFLASWGMTPHFVAEFNTLRSLYEAELIMDDLALERGEYDEDGFSPRYPKVQKAWDRLVAHGEAVKEKNEHFASL